ncbi:MAG: acyl carrier protein [Deltaproteobacteria bacterium]|jgi:acyl carrier protein|nr:MAG: acyl carrier protein [Deltaproteobacteria bacterium]TMB24524.1 MAG: acyl carrier protein [Deltaproteobacteria bacterium]
MVQQRIKAVLAEVFQIDPATLAPTASPADIEGWDSFGHLALVEALQTEFRVQFQVEDIARMESLGAIEQILLRRGVEP